MIVSDINFINFAPFPSRLRHFGWRGWVGLYTYRRFLDALVLTF